MTFVQVLPLGMVEERCPYCFVLYTNAADGGERMSRSSCVKIDSRTDIANIKTKINLYVVEV